MRGIEDEADAEAVALAVNDVELEYRIDNLTARMDNLAARIDNLAARMDRVETHLDLGTMD